jgi:hypothetical protein
MAFGGKEKTYQAWNGIDRKTWETDPKFNYSGAIYDSTGKTLSDFMIMKRIITDRIIISCFGNRNSMTDGI